MFHKLLSLIKSNKKEPPALSAHLCDEPAAKQIHLNEQFTLPFHQWTKTKKRFTTLDWKQAYSWIEHNIPQKIQSQAYLACQKTWLLYLRDNFIQRNPSYTLWEDQSGFILSTLDQNLSLAALAFIYRAKKRILHTLGDIGFENTDAKDTLIICENADDYYRYIMQYFPNNSETIPSSGVFINSGYGHFVTINANLSLIEPVIIHELTHSCLSNLPLPVWLNEGLAVSIEKHLTRNSTTEFSHHQMQHMHTNYWTTKTIQEFWFGQSFNTTASSRLAYDLAKNMVQLLGKNWKQFTQFALNAHMNDAGTTSAQKHFDFTLGQCVCILLHQPYSDSWEPQLLR